MKGRTMTLSDHLKLFLRNGSLFVIYVVAITSIPLFSLLSAHELIPYFSLIYQITGIFFLYLDEKYKMSRSSILYGRLNTFFMTILKSLNLSLNALKWVWRYIWNPPRKDCNITFDIHVTEIIHDYDKITDAEERTKAQLISFESDLATLRYFSELRKGGYIFLAIGFIMQFFGYILSKS